MLTVNNPRIKVLVEAIKKGPIEDINFSVVKENGLSIIVSHDSDDVTAKQVMKKYIADNAEMKRYFTSVMICDENGRIK